MLCLGQLLGYPPFKSHVKDCELSVLELLPGAISVIAGPYWRYSRGLIHPSFSRAVACSPHVASAGVTLAGMTFSVFSKRANQPWWLGRYLLQRLYIV